MATFTLVANINLGDETTVPSNLFFKIYNSDVLYHTTGKVSEDANVTLVGDVVTIVNIPQTGFENFHLKVTQVDEAQNEGGKSNEISVGPVLSFYEEGFYESGFYQ